MSDGDIETLFEEKQHEVESLLGSLKSRDDYYSQEECDAIPLFHQVYSQHQCLKHSR